MTGEISGDDWRDRGEDGEIGDDDWRDRGEDGEPGRSVFRREWIVRTSKKKQFLQNLSQIQFVNNSRGGLNLATTIAGISLFCRLFCHFLCLLKS
nr:hypothetical protein CFP56_14371 [Quercus suber]